MMILVGEAWNSEEIEDLRNGHMNERILLQVKLTAFPRAPC